MRIIFLDHFSNKLPNQLLSLFLRENLTQIDKHPNNNKVNTLNTGITENIIGTQITSSKTSQLKLENVNCAPLE